MKNIAHIMSIFTPSSYGDFYFFIYFFQPFVMLNPNSISAGEITGDLVS